MTRTKRGLGLLACVAVCALLREGSAYADVTDQLLDRLQEKGILSKTEYKSFKARHAEEKRSAEHARVRTVVVTREPGTRQIVTKEGIKVVPVADDLVHVLKVKDQGIGVKVGEVDLTVSGNVNAFGVQDFGASNRTGQPIAGGLATGSRFLGGAGEASASYASRGGLLPSAFIFNAATHQGGYDIGFEFGVYPGINLGGTTVGGVSLGANSPGNPVGLQQSGIDFRQIFATVGNAQIGTLKGGRDIGLFGSDAILDDFTIFGVGSPGAAGGNRAPSNTSLGRIGLGYIYADFLPQLTYITPDYHGVTGTLAVIEPLQEVNFAGGAGGARSGTLTQADTPQIQAKVKYIGDVAPGTKLTAWVDGLTQNEKAARIGDALPGGQSTQVYAVDGGGKLDIGPLSLLGYGYYGDGLGTTALFYDGIDLFGNKRESYGGYGQVSYALTPKLSLAASYGISFLQATTADAAIATQGALVRSNESYFGAARYHLTTWVYLQGEYAHTISRSQNGNVAQENTLSAGTFLAF